MTCGELIESLKQLDPEMEVRFHDGLGPDSLLEFSLDEVSIGEAWDGSPKRVAILS